MKKTKKAPQDFSPRKSKDILVTQAMLDLTRQELKSDIVSVKLDIKALESKINARFEQVDARFEQVDARFEQVDAQLSEIRSKIELLISSIHRTNKFVLDGYSQIHCRVDQLDTRVKKLEGEPY